jgi:hypothetical protein
VLDYRCRNCGCVFNESTGTHAAYSGMRGKGSHLGPDDPPRCGYGTFANDRAPVIGVAGRQTGAVVSTDEWRGYAGLPEVNRSDDTVCHTPGEVPDNALEGL